MVINIYPIDFRKYTVRTWKSSSIADRACSHRTSVSTTVAIPLFLVIYLITIVGNLGLIALIWNDSQLHIPMYLFLGSLALVDTSISSTVTPKMLVNIINQNKRISLSECMVQFFSFVVSATTECFLLAMMSYDRYLAICNPLLYPAIMTHKQCMGMLVSSFVGGLFTCLNSYRLFIQTNLL